MPYDLSDNSGAEKPIPIDTGPPTGRASDVFRQPAPGPAGKQTKGGSTDEAAKGGMSLYFPSGQRPETPADGAVRSFLWLSLIVGLLGITYLLWGIWSGILAEPNFSHNYPHADRVRIVGNIQVVEQIVTWCTVIVVASIIFLFYDDTFPGYTLGVTAIFFFFGVPFLSGFLLDVVHSTPSRATNIVLPYFKWLANFPGIPGGLLMLWDIGRRAVNGLGEAQLRRTSLRYGQNVVKQPKRRNQFMGACYNLPFCRESIRVHCPVFLKKRGPCWKYKMGCMCDESIAVLASSPDWKAAVAVATAKLEGRPVPVSGNPLLGASTTKITLTKQEKDQRCRECIIYNTHQEQKYKLFTGMIFIGLGAVLYLFNAQLIGWITAGATWVNSTLGHFSFTANGGQSPFAIDTSTGISWVILAFVSIIVVSKLLQLVEYCCFKIKI